MSDSRRTVPRGLWLALVALVAATLIGELFVHHHGHFGVDGSFAFYGWYTLLCAPAGILIARLVAAVLGRGEDYHDG